MSELKPCPFCSSINIIAFCGSEDDDVYGHKNACVECYGCDAHTPNYQWQEEAIKAWNAGNISNEYPDTPK